jgi:hypothetical protein
MHLPELLSRRAAQVYLVVLAQLVFWLPRQQEFPHQRARRCQLVAQVDDSAAESFLNPGS